MKLNAEKQKIHLRGVLKGAKMYSALKMLNAVEDTYGTDRRKDGKTLSVMHPIQIALSVLILPVDESLKETLIIMALAHDMTEDYAFSKEDFVKLFGLEKGEWFYLMNCRLSKVVDNIKKSNQDYFSEIVNPECVIVKGLDRLNNLNSMVGVFSEEKMQIQVEETQQYVIPMLKKAERQYPEMELTIYAVRFQILQTLILIDHFLKGK